MSEKVGRVLWEKWNSRLYNWALCGLAKGIERAAIKAPDPKKYDEDHWRNYVDAKPKAGGNAETWQTEEPPGITIDGLDTDSLVIQLSKDHLSAVTAYWAMTGPMEYRASAIGCHVSTLYRRVDDAIIELERLDGARRCGKSQRTQATAASGVVLIRSTFVPENPDA